MTTKTTLALACVAAMAAACQSNFEPTANGLIATTQGGKEKVRLEAVQSKIIRVTATAAETFSTEESLIVLPQSGKTHFTTEVNDTIATLKTNDICATVDIRTGQVTFADSQGRTITCEQNGGGRTYTPHVEDGLHAYSVRQVWESPSDEAFYGLGQHQADEFNYKGLNEELFQYNTKISVPFVVSSRNYGILWHNYSLSRFGNAEDYKQLGEVFNLSQPDGEASAMKGTYRYADTVKLVRNEPQIYFENLKANKEFMVKDFDYGRGNVTFEGFAEPKGSGEHKFILYYSGYVRVFFDDEEVVTERWRTAWNPNSYKFSRQMCEGQKQKIRIEWTPDGGEAYCGLRVLAPVEEQEQAKLALWSEVADEVDYYFVSGQNADEVISGYRTLTGKAQIMPRWAMGYWQSRERYQSQDEILGALSEFRRRKFPIDNIVQDWNYWRIDQWGSHEFDAERFPDPQAMVDSIHAMNAKIMISVWPKFYVGTQHYDEFNQQGFMYQQAIRDSIYDWLGYMGSFYDAYAPQARELFWNQINEHLFSLGIDAWWMDASEPNVRDCTDTEYRKALCGPTFLGPSGKYFNTYSIVNADAIYSGQRSVAPNQRVFLLTRSGFAGLQRYSTASWSGDIATRWEDMKAQISAGINFALSGIPYWTMDIGGFCVEKRYEAAQRLFDATGRENADLREWRELNTRWFQFGAFCPLFRSHGQFPLREPWNIAPDNHPAYKSLLYYAQLRYELMPYIYSLAAQAHFADYTIMRGLIMDFAADTKVRNISDQYMFGPSLLVCPVYQYEARTRNVYFPATTGWYDFYTGQYHRGGLCETVAAPYGRMPLFVCEGAIIPCSQAAEHTEAVSNTETTIYVYAGANGSFCLYDDEGTNYDYEQGRYSKINFTYDDSSRTLIIADRSGRYDQMSIERKFNVVLVSPEKPQAFSPTAKGVVIEYNGTNQVVKL